MYSKEVYDLLEEVIHKKRKINRLCTHPLYSILLKETSSFVKGLNSEAKGTQRLWHVKNNVKSVPVCRICSSYTSWNSSTGTYREYCSVKCATNSPNVREKSRQTNLKNLGVAYPSQSKIVEEKRKQNNRIKFGVDYPSQLETTKEKSRQTNLKNLGVDNPFKSQQIKKQIKQIHQKNLGVDNPMQSERVKEKSRQTCIKEYGVPFALQVEEVKEKSRQTYIKEYGVKNPSQKHISPNIIENLNNKNWIIHQHYDQRKPFMQICFELGVSESLVAKYAQKHDIKARYYNSSYKCIQWLETTIKKQNIFIQHAKNIGEYKILGTKIRVDGYCQETNTVYEFYGDCWHGNLCVFKPNEKCHPRINDITASELHRITLNRENKIRELGYNLIVMWENTWEHRGSQNGTD